MVVLGRSTRSLEESLVCMVARVQVDFSSSLRGTTVMCPMVGPVVAGCNATGGVNLMNPGRHGVPEHISSDFCVWH